METRRIEVIKPIIQYKTSQIILVAVLKTGIVSTTETDLEFGKISLTSANNKK